MRFLVVAEFIEHIDDKTKPEANWQAGFNAAVIAIKSNEAVANSTKIVFDKSWFQV